MIPMLNYLLSQRIARRTVNKIVDKTKTTFMCPICKKEVEIGECGKSLWPDKPMTTGSRRGIYRNIEWRLSNKRFHMEQHR